MTPWSVMSWLLLPIAFITMTILMIPLPLQWESKRLEAIEYIFELRVPQMSPVFANLSIFNTIMTLALILCGLEFYKIQPDKQIIGNQLISIKASRWRKERNFWISAMTFIMYFMNWRYYILKRQLVQINNKLIKVHPIDKID